MPQLKSKLPPLYHGFFPDFIEKNFPEEKWATCTNCTLCRSAKSPYVDTKCCNYYPYLANYLVGGILQDTRAEMDEGKRRIRALMQNKLGVTPYAIIPPNEYTAREKAKIENKQVGLETREEYNAQQCPYLHVGRCTIWEYRENLCSTHFCISAGGGIGNSFWKKTNKYLKMVENVLSNYALYELSENASEIKTNSVQDIKFGTETEEGLIDIDSYNKLWGKWLGKEEEFYIQCYQLVASLDEQKFVELCGHKQVILAQGMQEVLNSFNKNIIPEHLMLHPDVVVHTDDQNDNTLILNDQSYKISSVLYMIIKRFDGSRTTKSIIDEAFMLMINVGTPLSELYGKGMLVPVVYKQESTATSTFESN